MYGGTKTEMERLLADAEKLTGVKYDISNLGDVYEAIHVIQGDLGLTGVAAAEASETFTGSFGAMKAAAENLLANLALGEDVTASMEALGGNLSAFIFNNLIPMLVNIVSGIPDMLVAAYNSATTVFMDSGIQTVTEIMNGITETLPGAIESGGEILNSIIDGITEALPGIVDAATQMMDEFISFIENDLDGLLDQGVAMITNIVNGILQNLPQLITMGGELIAKLVEAIYKMTPKLLSAGADLVLNLVKGLIQNFPEIMKAIQDAMANIYKVIGENYPQFIQKGIEIVGKLVTGLVDSIPSVVSGVIQIVTNAKDAFLSVDWLSIGKNIVDGVISGIQSAGSALYSSLKNLASNALDAAKDALKIGSPSKVFADQVGQWIPAGIAEGVKDNMDALSDTISGVSSLATVDGATLSSAHQYGAELATVTSAGNVVNMTIYGAKGQSETALAEIISRKINASVNRRGAVWA